MSTEIFSGGYIYIYICPLLSTVRLLISICNVTGEWKMLEGCRVLSMLTTIVGKLLASIDFLNDLCFVCAPA